MNLLDDQLLERSAVVANCHMNRDRTLTGANGYVKELGFNPLVLLREKSKSAAGASWLDLCCGSGKALVESARILRDEGPRDRCQIVGVDLVGMFVPVESPSNCLRLIQAPLSDWRPDRQFDAITCVHGLHYIGDKLGLISRAASWLTDDGRFVASLDVANIKYPDGRSASRIVCSEMRHSGLEYNPRKKRLTCSGRRIINFSLRYVGADDQAGPNYTGQPAVNSCYVRANATD